MTDTPGAGRDDVERVANIILAELIGVGIDVPGACWDAAINVLAAMPSPAPVPVEALEAARRIVALPSAYTGRILSKYRDADTVARALLSLPQAAADTVRPEEPEGLSTERGTGAGARDSERVARPSPLAGPTDG